MKAARFLAALLCLMLVAVSSVSAHGGRGRVGIHIGSYWGPWFYPPPWYYQPTIVVPPPPPPTVYIEQSVAPGGNLWHYCRSAGGYYPYVQACPEGWLKVLPESGR